MFYYNYYFCFTLTVLKMENLICDKIRILRITKGYSQSYIAFQLKVSQGYYSKMENGCKPISDYYLKRLSKILEVNLLN